MFIEVQKKETKKLETTPVVQQTAFWSKVKRKQGFYTNAFDISLKTSEIFEEQQNNNYIREDFLVLFRTLENGYKIGYVPYGPTLEPCQESQGPLLEELSESLRPFLPNDCFMLRFDLLWESLWAKSYANPLDESAWIEPPKKLSQEFRYNINTQNWNLRKANTDILPTNTIFLDLKVNKTTLLNRMKPKTRYNIRLSKRKGVEVKSYGLDKISIWYDLYKETASRNGIFIQDMNPFKTVLETSAYDTNSPVDVCLLVAEKQGKPLAAMFFVMTGKRGVYLYGASSSIGRNLMPTYALQWEAICRAKDNGCTEYDMFGIAPKPDPSHPLYGLYRFKSGFGGYMFQRMGCWDYPLNDSKYFNYAASEMNSQGFHL